METKEKINFRLFLYTVLVLITFSIFLILIYPTNQFKLTRYSRFYNAKALQGIVSVKKTDFGTVLDSTTYVLYKIDNFYYQLKLDEKQRKNYKVGDFAEIRYIKDKLNVDAVVFDWYFIGIFLFGPIFSYSILVFPVLLLLFITIQFIRRVDISKYFGSRMVKSVSY